MGKRRKGREVLLQALYAAEVGGFPLRVVLSEQLRRREVHDETNDFAERLGRLIDEHLPETDRWFAGLVEHWDPERVGQVERAILRLALTELRWSPEVPYRVVINEACELARRYAAESAVAFVNGVLDRAASQVLAGEAGAAPDPGAAAAATEPDATAAAAEPGATAAAADAGAAGAAADPRAPVRPAARGAPKRPAARAGDPPRAPRRRGGPR